MYVNPSILKKRSSKGKYYSRSVPFPCPSFRSAPLRGGPQIPLENGGRSVAVRNKNCDQEP